MFHICNRLPLMHDNKPCVKEIAYAQLKQPAFMYY